MKSVIAICLLFVVLGEIARDWPRAETEVPTAAASEFPWVRTVDGWERLDTSTQRIEPDRPHPRLHPGVVAAAMVLASLWGLLWSSDARRQRTTPDEA